MEKMQVILFALLFGLALSKAGTSGQKLRSFFTDVNEVMMRLITMIIANAYWCVLSDDPAWGDLGPGRDC